MAIKDHISKQTPIISRPLEIATHPLNSVNPPPADLPDLLDNLLVSNAQIRDKVSLCGRMGSTLHYRTGLILHCLVALKKANPELQRLFIQSPPHQGQDDTYKVYSAQNHLLSEMIRQLTFISWMYRNESTIHLDRLMAAHQHIFTEFLGMQHEHATSQELGRTTTTCINGCEWYSKHGPYEWNRQPYTKNWWSEMNSTDWDWIRVREHIQNLITEGGTTMMNIDTLHCNVLKHIPQWVWHDSRATWKLKATIQTSNSHKGVVEDGVRLFVRYEKSNHMKQHETARLEQNQRQIWIRDGMDPKEAATKPVEVCIDQIGTWVADQYLVFDAPELVPNWDQGGQPASVGTWLRKRGYMKWQAEQTERIAGVFNNPVANARRLNER